MGMGRLSRRFWQAIAIVVAVLIVLVVVYVGFQKVAYKTYTAYFASVNSMYEGDAVKILGVTVGSVGKITPRDGDVKVELKVDRDQTIPADAEALVVAQSLVSGRFVQLTPVYEGGPALKDGGAIPMERTAVPVEWDDIKSELTKLTEAVGPDGADPGSVARAVDVADANLDGNGTAIRQSLQQLSDVTSTLADGRDDLFNTIRNLQALTEALSQSHEQLVQFNGRIASVSQVLADNTESLNGALTNLDTALSDVKSFIDTNGATLSDSVARLGDATNVLAQKDEEIRGLLHSGPTQLSNFYNIYNPLQGSLSGIFGLGMGGNLINLLCGTIQANDRPGQEGDVEKCVDVLAPVLASISVNYPPALINPVTGVDARPDQIQYQNASVKARAQQSIRDQDAETRKKYDNPGLAQLLVPFGGEG
ncbi:MCE family protein [Williamsia muralis]|uniref:Mammalian cell entry protein n=1 Tax=Williamsia marianensis TaxID=85044 RepID=A0A2G3PHT2_WILMA|nr:MCE family protein [Williamsia marianensis]PHV65256.1 mammalian cell entry protein [Williamsia marianensis]